MNEDTYQIISEYLDQMDVKYGKPVFDEWMVLSLNENRGKLLHYSGARKSEVQTEFAKDAANLKKELLSETHVPGDFEFSREGVGTGFDAFMALGQHTFLICNNTHDSMSGITKNPLWLGAQVPFVELSEQFRDNPIHD